MKRKSLTNNKNAQTHGLSKTRLHTIWHSMYCRCYYPTTNGYNRYGGREIKVCDEWKKSEGFVNFYNWAIANGYQEDLTLDRIDVNGNYEPSNCRWITKQEQQLNMRSNKYITYKGERKIQAELCREYNVSATTLNDRLKRGWTLEEALTISTKGLQRKVKR